MELPCPHPVESGGVSLPPSQHVHAVTNQESPPNLELWCPEFLMGFHCAGVMTQIIQTSSPLPSLEEVHLPHPTQSSNPLIP